jgi:hypothetical protein
MAFEFCDASQAEQAPAFHGIVRHFSGFQAAVLDRDEFVQRKIRQADKSFESEGIEAVIADKEAVRDGETAPGQTLPVDDLLRNVPAGFHKSHPSVGLADHDAHEIPAFGLIL